MMQCASCDYYVTFCVSVGFNFKNYTYRLHLEMLIFVKS